MLAIAGVLTVGAGVSGAPKSCGLELIPDERVEIAEPDRRATRVCW
ncbi:hypothetical protein ACWDOP_14020 [Nocardia sp. NPDC003693]